MAYKNDFGALGEQLACDYLVEKGYVIRERNWRCHRDEVDIIATKDDVLVFVEVKARSGSSLQSPLQAVDYAKRESYIRCANAYVQQKRLYNEVRFDIVGLLSKPEGMELTHEENAFSAVRERRRPKKVVGLIR